LAELKKKHGTPPNIIHIMWDDTALSEVGIPEIQAVRGFETPVMNKMAEGILNHIDKDGHRLTFNLLVTLGKLLHFNRKEKK